MFLIRPSIDLDNLRSLVNPGYGWGGYLRRLAKSPDGPPHTSDKHVPTRQTLYVIRQFMAGHLMV